uniref:Ovule protein n=1 Tax=Strongyloides papillosus TaxID=174720 RepID=A0A0N5B973_STREA
ICEDSLRLLLLYKSKNIIYLLYSKSHSLSNHILIYTNTFLTVIIDLILI